MASWGTLGRTPGVSDLWHELGLKSVQARQFGWGQDGIGGNWRLLPVQEQYYPGRSNAPEKSQFHIAAKFHASWTSSKNCLREDNDEFFTQNYLFPQWFFDWGKRYLFLLRTNQPAFDAPVETKMVWITHVAWTVNMMLSATNVHGSFLSMALYEEVTGATYSQWSGNGGYMFPTLHFQGLPSYYAEAAEFIVASNLGTMPNNAAIDIGLGVFNRSGGQIARSTWLGAPWSMPFETRRYRWVSTPWQGKKFGENSRPNDPYFVDDGKGGVQPVGSAVVDHYTRWSYAVPWILGIQTWGSTKKSKVSGGSASMAEAALQMSTFFGWDQGDRYFWEHIERWKKAQYPDVYDAKFTNWIREGHSLHRLNEEFCFRYYAPAMADMLLQCDYSSLVTKGFNLWWRYNVGSLEQSEATYAPGPELGLQYDAEGAPRRGPNGDRIVPLVASTKHIEMVRDAWQSSEDRRMYRGIIMNVIRTVIALIQALYGNYGSLVGAAKGWYTLVDQTYPQPEDHWLGVVNLLPPVMRESLIPVSWKNGARIDTDWKSGPNLNGLRSAFVIATLRNAAREWERRGVPFRLSEDLLNLYVVPASGAKRSPRFPEPEAPTLPKPPSSPFSLTPQGHPPAPTALEEEEKGKPWGWALAAAVVVGSYAVYRTRRNK